MPRHVRSPQQSAAKYQDLVDRLADELRSPSNAIQPVILEDVTEITNTSRVRVVWQEWHNVPHDVRTAIILDSYEAVYGEEKRKQITLALGFDYLEARNIGLLPFAVRPSGGNGVGKSFTQYHDAMRAHGAPVEYADHGPQLWFATQGDAEAAAEQLQQRLPGSKWIVVEEAYGDAW